MIFYFRHKKTVNFVFIYDFSQRHRAAPHLHRVFNMAPMAEDIVKRVQFQRRLAAQAFHDRWQIHARQVRLEVAAAINLAR